MSIYDEIAIARKEHQKKMAVLVDPDKQWLSKLDQILYHVDEAEIDYFMVGGSLLTDNSLNQVIREIKNQTSIPVLLFPGNSFQLSNHADAVLLLSLISGRNAELLIGQHVQAAPFLKESRLEIIPTGYILIEGGVSTSVSYMSNTQPIPADKWEIARCTAMAGQMLGLKLIYLDAGSGAKFCVSRDTIESVNCILDIPLIVGGGINTPEKASKAIQAGADMIVVGTAVEKDPHCLREIANAVKYKESKVEK